MGDAEAGRIQAVLFGQPAHGPALEPEFVDDPCRVPIQGTVFFWKCLICHVVKDRTRFHASQHLFTHMFGEMTHERKK